MKLPSIKKIPLHVAAALWLALCIVIALDLWAIYRSYGVLRHAQVDEQPFQTTRSVRINFENYNAAASRIEGGRSFQPQQVSERNPFLPIPKKGEQN